MLRLSSRGIFKTLESGPARSVAISAASGAVGLTAGKLEDARKTPLVAVAGGAALQLVGLHTLGDGAMAGGASIIGYRTGARWGKRRGRVAEVIPGTPVVHRAHPGHPGHQGHRKA